MAKLSISQASKEWGVSRQSISGAIRSGQLVASSGPRNSKAIDMAELIRVFGEPYDNSKSAGKSMSEQVASQVEINSLRRENLLLKDQLNKAEERERNALAIIERLTTPSAPSWRYLLPWNKG